MTALTLQDIVGRWTLIACEVRIGDTVNRPLGEHPEGVLSYTRDGWMFVQIVGRDRAALASTDPLGGTEQERAAAYATCLAYCGTYELRGEHIVHRIQLSSFPNWAGDEQVRFVDLDGDRLALRTEPIETPAGTFAAELRWVREG